MSFPWSETQKKCLEKMNIPFDFNGDLSDDEILKLDDIVTDYMMMHCISNDEVTPTGRICESIIDTMVDCGA